MIGADRPGLLERLLGALFPERCLGCGLRGAALCPDCEGLVPWLGPDACPRCAKPTRLGRVCAGCQREPLTPDGVRAACRFEGVARSAVHDLKYRGIKGRADLLGRLIAEALAARPLALDAIVPVPLAPNRQRRRGFNQSALIGRHIADALGVPLSEGALVRARETPRQVGKSAAERRANVADAFACRLPELVTGRRIGVVDDVMTTGATLDACAVALKAAGASRVYGIVVAREV
jgi:ComF family protein